MFVYDVYKWPRNVWRHQISRLLQSFGGQTLRRIWNLACKLLTYSSYIYLYGFLKIWKILNFRALFPEKLVFLIWGQNPKIWKIRDSHLVDKSISLFWHLLFAIFFSIHWSAIDIADDHFCSKSHDMTSLKRHFLKKNLTEFDKIFRQGVKLMSDKVLEVLWRYLTYLSSYSKYSRGGRICPPAGSGLTVLRSKMAPTESCTGGEISPLSPPLAAPLRITYNFHPAFRNCRQFANIAMVLSNNIFSHIVMRRILRWRFPLVRVPWALCNWPACLSVCLSKDFR